MKKFFAIAFIAASLVACGGGEEKPVEGTDTTTVAPEPTPEPAPAPDTTKVADTTKAPAAAPAEAPKAEEKK